MKKRFRVLLLFMLVFFSSKIQAQFFFNSVDTNVFLNNSVVEESNSFIFSGDLWSIGSTRSVNLSYYANDGICLNNDTLNQFPEVTTGSKILKRTNDFLVYNIINDIPPFLSTDRDIELSSFNFSGIELWTHRYGGNNQEVPSDIISTSDGGIIITGTTHSFGEINGDFYLLKTDENGNIIWQYTYGGNTSDIAYSVSPTIEGNFIISGHKHINASDWDIYLVLIDSLGNMIWEKNYGGSYTDYGGILTALNDHSFIIYRNIDNGINTAGMVDKLDGNGNIIWSKSFIFNNYTSFSFVKPIQNSDGTIMVSCVAKNNNDQPVCNFIKLDPLGNTIWTKEYLTRPDFPQYIYDTKSTSDAGYIMCGSAFDADSLQRGWIIKTDCNGNEDVLYPTGAPCNEYDCSQFPIDASFTSSNILVDLAIGNTVTFDNGSINSISRVWNFGDGNIDYSDATISHTFAQTGIYNVSLIVFHGMCSDTSTQTIEVFNSAGLEEVFIDSDKILIHPNPTTGMITLSSTIGNLFFEVFDIQGREIISQRKFNYKTELSLTEQFSGVYLVKITNSNGQFTIKRIVKN